MANFYSYVPALCRYLRTVEPKRILEWGPGESTKIMRQLCHDADIISIEDSQEYYDEWKSMDDGKQVHIYYIPIKDGYSSFPLILGGEFDFVFIDGKDEERPECLRCALKILSEDGVVILHDSEREWYREAIGLFKTVEETDGTIVLVKNKVNPKSLALFERKVHSQNGEDGIIEHVFQQIGTVNKQLVEIGFEAECNTRNLICNAGWQGLLIDMNPENVKGAKEQFGCEDNARFIEAFVTRENVNELLRTHAFGDKPDLFSIDIDGMEYHVWKAITAVDARVVVVEYNASFGPDLSVTVPYDPKFDRMKINPLYHGASLAALTKLAENKGYGLIGCDSHGVNAFYAKLDCPVEFLSAREAFVEHYSRKPWRFAFMEIRHLPLEEV